MTTPNFKETAGDTYGQLRELLRRAPAPTLEELEDQRFDFAYGNLAASTNHKPSREAFRQLAQERGWTIERFDTWASDRQWRT